MQDWIIELLPTLALVLSFFLNVINMVYTRMTGKSIDKELSMIKYTADGYTTVKDKEPKGTTFSNLIPQYRLNKATGMLEEAEPLDITALCNSSRNVELKELLARLESGTAELTQTVKTQYEDYSDDLDEMANALDIAEDYRERFGMNENVPVSDIFKRIEQERDKLKQSLETLEKAQEQPKQSEVQNAQETQNEQTQE